MSYVWYQTERKYSHICKALEIGNVEIQVNLKVIRSYDSNKANVTVMRFYLGSDWPQYDLARRQESGGPIQESILDAPKKRELIFNFTLTTLPLFFFLAASNE